MVKPYLQPHLLIIMVAATLTADASLALDALEEDTQISLRVRSAGHELDGDHGDSASFLLRLSYAATWRENLSTFIEFDYVETYLEDQFSDGVRLNGEPFVFDAEGPDLNQVFVDVNLDETLLRLGRQRLNFDDQRMVGAISIWQNEQTFDALEVSRNLASASRLSYTYASNVNRVLGEEAGRYLSPDDVVFDALDGRRPDALLGDHDLNSHFLRLEFNEWDYSRWVAYAYLDDNHSRQPVSNRTLGFSYNFDYKADLLRYRLRLDGALQQRPEVASSSRIPYGLLELGLRYNSLELMSRTEVLGEDDNVAFVTPLGSIHEFNGWADKFLLTPPGGLVDQSLQLTWRHSPWRISARYHVFNEYDGGSRYGDEFDLDIIYRLMDRHDVHLRYALFRATDEFAATFPNASKYFVTYSYNFN